jgi:hypothetical protein
MRKRILITIILSLSIPSTILSEAPVSASKTPKEIEALVMPWRFYKRLARCETNSRWHTSTRNYTSGYGIAIGTWQRFSNSSNADRYTPIHPARIVDRIAWLGHTEPSGEFVHPVGPYGWSVIKSQNCMGLQGFVCRSPHPKVQRWKRYC